MAVGAPNAQQIAIVSLSALPPSVNSMFANRPGGRFKTKAYKDWLTLAGHELNRQKPGRVAGPYAVTFTFGRVNKRADLDNIIKASADLLVSHGVVDDDRFAQRIVAEWGPVEGVHIQICSTKLRGEA